MNPAARTDATIVRDALTKIHGLLLSEIDADARRLAHRDHDRLAPFAQVGVFEDDFVSANPPREIADRGFSHPLAIDEYFRPRLRIDAEHAVRYIDRCRRRFPAVTFTTLRRDNPSASFLNSMS